MKLPRLSPLRFERIFPLLHLIFGRSLQPGPRRLRLMLVESDSSGRSVPLWETRPLPCRLLVLADGLHPRLASPDRSSCAYSPAHRRTAES
jgi:hypothetical protein